jgi:hypothetical protein
LESNETSSAPNAAAGCKSKPRPSPDLPSIFLGGMRLALRLAATRNSLMQPATIICDNMRPTAAPCGETALVHGVRYIYAPAGAGASAAAPVLREAQFLIDCPRCGKRTQIERYE